MRHRRRTLLVAGAVVILMGGSLAASALWRSGVAADVPAVAIGAVRFGAEGEDNTGTREFSRDGAAVTVRLPGSTVIDVLDQTSVEAPPVIWRFTAVGSALGIAGLNYDVTVAEQAGDAGAHDLSAGIAQPGTVLERSTLKVYRAGTGSDCSAIPATPQPVDGEAPKNVYVFETVDVELQRAGAALEGIETAQEWCVAIDWNDVEDGTYVNDVQVTGTAEDGNASGAVARWHSQVGFPPALEKLGVYRNLARVEATAEDTSKARASAKWEADIYPDPSGEPDVVISLDPIVTNVNPSVAPRD